MYLQMGQYVVRKVNFHQYCHSYFVNLACAELINSPYDFIALPASSKRFWETVKEKFLF